MADTRTPPTSPTPPATPPPASPPSAPPRLTRPRDDRVIGGVASGIARHLGLDPALVRIAFVVLALAGGSGVLAYLIAWLVIPEEPADAAGVPTGAAPDAPTLRMAAGAFLVLVGLALLLGQLVPDLSRIVWPVALIAVGGVIVLAGARR